MKKKKNEYRSDLYTEIGWLRSLPDRLTPIVDLVEPVDNLLRMIREDHPNIKAIAGIVEHALERAKEAIGKEQSP